MYICKYCLQAIENHEGNQWSKRIKCIDFFIPEKLIKEDEHGEELMTCEWCGEDTPLDEMYEVFSHDNYESERKNDYCETPMENINRQFDYMEDEMK